MAYDFLGLVNDVNARLNEVQLTSSTFSTASGFYQQGKDAVNSAIRYVNQSQFEWPFNHVEQEDVLTVGTTRYGFPTDMKSPDMDTFRIKRDSTLGNDTRKLTILSYEEYLEKFIDQEYNESTNLNDLPQYVVRTPSGDYALVPPPKEAYTLVYEYFRFPVDLENSTDVPNIPERFRYIIVDGAMYYAYLFRSNSQDAVLMRDKLEEGIKHMRTILTNRTEYVRSTAINQKRIFGTFVGRL
tara:strand:+ start:692 stop:1414 length:723 start_codon:yes stop_codon:yes gene_type:complete